MASSPSKSDVINAFKDFEGSLSRLCDVLKDDKKGHKYVDRTFETAGEFPFATLTMDKQVNNIKAWVNFIEKEINSMK